MKKIFFYLFLLTFVIACSKTAEKTKDSTDSTETNPPVTNSGEMVFIQKIEPTALTNISKSVLTQADYDSVETEIKGYYDSLVPSINQKTGRNIPNDSYFVFDKNGNVLEMAIKTLEDDGDKLAAIFKYDILQNNVPVFIEKNHFEYSNSFTIVGLGKDLFYNKGSVQNNIKLSSTISAHEDPTYGPSIDRNTTNSSIKYDLQSRITEISIDSAGRFIVKEDVPVAPQFIDLNSNLITNLSSYNNLKMVYDYNKNEGTLYSNDTKIGATKDFKMEYTISNGKITAFSIDIDTNNLDKSIEISYNTLGNVTEIKSMYGKKQFEYDTDLPYILKNYYEYNSSGALVQSHKTVFTKTNDGKIASYTKTITTTWGSATGLVTSTEVLSFVYKRDSNGNITEVESDLSLMDGVRLKGTFVPKL